MVRTRFSPSPTGMMHIGNARAALFSALYAAQNKGVFILRIEDTDLARSEQKYTDMLQDDLHWLGVNWQEGPGVGGPHQPYWQSQRHAIYEQYYQQLEEQGLAYPCFCSDQQLAVNRKIQLSRGQAPRYPGTCRELSKEEVAERITKGQKPALRFRVPDKKVIEFVDLVKGQQRFNSDDIGDFIIRRAEGTASFMFCNAVDDSLMEVTHVLRGDDHLANTPRQLMILQALKMRVPHYGHLSLITGDDGAKLSKRHGSFNLHDLVEQGYLTLAVLNYLARLSHSCESLKLMDFNELAANFRLDKLSRAPARFDKNQLLHWQKEAVMALNTADALEWLRADGVEKVPADKRELFADVMKKNILFPHEAQKWVEIFFGDEPQFTHEQIDVLRLAKAEFFTVAKAAVQQHGVEIKKVLDEVKAKLSVSGKQLFMPLRIALTGEEHGPELAPIAMLLGQEKMLSHLDNAIRSCSLK